MHSFDAEPVSCSETGNWILVGSIVQITCCFPVLWAVVNNAGIVGVNYTECFPLEKYRDLYEVNTLGTVRVSKALLPYVRQANGRVVNVCSQLGELYEK